MFLEREIEVVKPTHIIALGNEALLSLTGNSGITKYRGRVQTHSSGAIVIPTISPSMVLRNPGQRASFIADLNFARNIIDGTVEQSAEGPREILYIKTKEAFKRLLNLLNDESAERAIDAISVDIETTGYDEFLPESALVSIALTIRYKRVIDGDQYVCVAIPLFHPQSPFRSQWRAVIRILGKALRNKKLVAHNGKFDFRWLAQFGVELPLRFDTMLAAHILDENREKGLKPLARMICGAPAWAMSTKDLLTDPIDEVLEYNAYDTWWTIKIYEHFRHELQKPENKAKARLFVHLLMPGSEELIIAERHGIWVDVEMLATNTRIAESNLEAVRAKLYEYVPDDHPFITLARDGSVKSNGVNFNPSNFLRWWIFEYLGMPVLARGKEKDDGSPGDPSVGEAVMLALKGKHEVIELLLEHQNPCDLYPFLH